MTLLRLALPALLLALFLVPATALAQDEDGDGRAAGPLDCDDTDATIYLGAPEVCDDGIDQSCSGGDLLEDADEDGWNDVRCFDAVDCDATPEDPACDDENFDCDDSDAALNRDDADGDGFSTCEDDCDDEDATVDPVDDDGDGFDECSGGDCDDSSVDVSPSQDEVCGDALDNDCDGEADNIDADADGAISEECGGEDCDDDDASLNPNNPEAAATCNDTVDNDCDGVADNLDDDCFEEPEVVAGADLQDRYLGGTVLVVLDGSDTTDFNVADTLTYQWTIVVDGEATDGVVELSADETSPYGFLRFRAPASDTQDWNYIATLTVSDGNPATDDVSDAINVRFWRPSYVTQKGCSQSTPTGVPAALAMLLMLGATTLRRRR